MVGIATVMVMDPKIMIYDEPTASLDIQSRRDVINLIKRENKTHLVASHDLDFIKEICTRVIILNHGKSVADGEPAVIMSDAGLMKQNRMEVPYSLR